MKYCPVSFTSKKAGLFNRLIVHPETAVGNDIDLELGDWQWHRPFLFDLISIREDHI
jgi:hypothetical protein